MEEDYRTIFKKAKNVWLSVKEAAYYQETSEQAIHNGCKKSADNPKPYKSKITAEGKKLIQLSSLSGGATLRFEHDRQNPFINRKRVEKLQDLASLAANKITRIAKCKEGNDHDTMSKLLEDIAKNLLKEIKAFNYSAGIHRGKIMITEEGTQKILQHPAVIEFHKSLDKS